MEQSKRWEPAEILLIVLLIIVGFAIRYYGLDHRALHHDESLHGMYSLYYLENPSRSFYKYDPLLHGPLLYHIVPWFFYFLGITKFALRLPAVILGSCLMLLPLLLKRYLSKVTCLSLLALIAVSPTLTYWSRFIRHDGFVLFGILLSIAGVLARVPLIKVILVALGFALQFCAKENSYIHLLFIFVYLFYESVINYAFDLNEDTLLKRLISFILQHPLLSLLGVGIFTGVYIHYYTAGFIYWDGAIDGAYRKSLVYWFQQHHQERITGPFSYPFLVNSLFEAWWLPALLVHLYVFYKRQTWIIILGFFFALLFGALTHFLIGDGPFKEFISTYLKCKIPLDYYLFFPLIFHAVVAPTTYLLEKKGAKALTAFLFFASLFTYSYLGEKVPWLAVYPLMTGLIFMCFEYDRTFHWPIFPIFILLLCHLVYTNYWANFLHSDSPKNLLTQVHTTKEFEGALKEVGSQMESHPQGKGPYFLVKGKGTWPTTWYLHGRREYHFRMGQKPLLEYTYILGEPHDQELNQKLAEYYTKEIIPLRAWWLPDYKNLSLKGLGTYLWKKEPWNMVGSENLALWVKKNSLGH